MANPQKENGYTAIANEIIEKIISSNLNGTEVAVLLYILRKTYGFNKKEDEISLSQFLNVIPTSKRMLCYALNNLQLVKIITLVKKGNSKNSSNLYTFNKNYDEWELVKKTTPVKKELVKIIAPTSEVLCTQLVKKTSHTKEILQKQYTKESISDEASHNQDIQTIFNTFYDEGNRGINFGNKTERKAAEWLLKEYGLEKTINTIKYAMSVAGKIYAPVITTPFQLKNNIIKLIAYYNREKEPKKGSVPAINF